MKVVFAAVFLLCLSQVRSMPSPQGDTLVFVRTDNFVTIEDVKQFVSIIEKIVDKIAQISRDIGGGRIAEAIEAIQRAVEDVKNVQEATLLKRTAELKKRIIDTKKGLGKLEKELRVQIADSVSEFSSCSNDALKHGEDLAISLRDLQVKLTNLDKRAKEIIEKCRNENVNYFSRVPQA